MGFSRAPEDRPTPKEVYNYRIYILTFLACLGSWMFGYNNGVIGGVLVLPSFMRDFNLPLKAPPTTITLLEISFLSCRLEV